MRDCGVNAWRIATSDKRGEGRAIITITLGRNPRRTLQLHEETSLGNNEKKLTLELSRGDLLRPFELSGTRDGTTASGCCGEVIPAIRARLRIRLWFTETFLSGAAIAPEG